MRLVYAHFPINANAESGGKELSIRNFLGEKVVRHIPMGEGVIVKKDVDVKDQLLFEGNNIEHVSRCVLLLVTVVLLLARTQRVVMLW
jgi:large subunit ribosomal protein L9e